MRFRHFDALRAFSVVAEHSSFSAAAEELNLTKGAVSYQVKLLEEDLGFALFDRLPRGVSLTEEGRALLDVSTQAFAAMERKIGVLKHQGGRVLTIGITTYFASRWLSSRLMRFMSMHPDIRLRLQPMIDLLDLRGEGVDLAIRWGRGQWTDVTIEPFLPCPAWPTGNAEAAALVRDVGLTAAFRRFTLLRDRKDSNAWSEWFHAAGLDYEGDSEALIIPDPNVRVQAVIDGQGVALNDRLILPEIEKGTLFQLSDTELDDYGYFLAYTPGALENPQVACFVDWLKKVT